MVVGQVPVEWDLERNRRTVVSFLRENTRPADVVILPEAALSGYDDELSGLTDLDPAALAAVTEAVSATARECAVHLICGTLWFDGRGWCNTAIYFGPDGRRWSYQKVNLAQHERGRLTAGAALSVLSMPDLKVGVQLCREIRFPEQWHVLARAGAQLFAYLTYAANPREPAGVWRSHLISRAAETPRFLAAANVAHPDQHCPSVIVSPRGEVLAEAGTGEPAALRWDLDLGEVRGSYLSQQRADVVAVRYQRE